MALQHACHSTCSAPCTLQRHAYVRGVCSQRGVVRCRDDVNAALADGWTALHYAADRSDAAGPPMVRQLVLAGANVDVVNEVGVSPLQLAVDAGQLDSVAYLLVASADVDNADRSGYTALHTAARRGYTKLVQALCDAGADPNPRALGNGRTPAHAAACAGHAACLSILARAGADLRAKEEIRGESVLHMAAAAGWLDACRTALEYGAVLNDCTQDGLDVVAYARKGSQLQVAERLPALARAARRMPLLLLIELVRAGRAVPHTAEALAAAAARAAHPAGSDTAPRAARTPAAAPTTDGSGSVRDSGRDGGGDSVVASGVGSTASPVVSVQQQRGRGAARAGGPSAARPAAAEIELQAMPAKVQPEAVTSSGAAEAHELVAERRATARSASGSSNDSESNDEET
ncbi:hypothetical protein EON68_03140, partial [archaeon]